jgi:hypothetical protein
MIKKNRTTYNRAQHDSEHPYSLISNKLLSDLRISVTSKGIMSVILHNADSYIINMSLEQQRSGLGYTAFNKAIHQLRETGYICKLRVKDGTHWVINEEANY